MRTIDRETVQKILDTADIVEVVSDFVSLRKRGANYIGLCPFHNERTPSFSVSRAKGICKCFSCGKGGSPVNFIMEHEQMTYWEALRYLAKKYHIEIQEHEVTDSERQEMNERQGMMDVNEFAMTHFEKNLSDTPDGREIGLAYFRERGINDWAVNRFHLGYSVDQRDDLYTAAKAQGLNEKYLLDTGLCSKNDRGVIYDRFRGRVMYPVFTISGKVVAFGGRTLRSDKEVAKYVNSPESLIYSKSRELYGLYQAKKSIVQKDKCILVEGYMDVISMHQQGIENVVASSGTALTQGQIRLIHRFTDNITVIYDSDPAGIKASLRGIDLILAEGLNVKVLLLPEGDDPDSFAQSHTTKEVEDYLFAKEIDFIKFKMDILLKDCENDPINRSKVLGSIIHSIAHIPVELTRVMYIKECSLKFGIDEAVLIRQLNVDVAKLCETNARNAHRQAAINSIDAPSANLPATDYKKAEGGNCSSIKVSNSHASMLEPQERALLRIVVKYGLLDLGEDFGRDADGSFIKVIDYIREDLDVDGMTFTNELYQRIYNEALQLRNESWIKDRDFAVEQAIKHREDALCKGRDKIKLTASTLEEINIAERKLSEKCDEDYNREVYDYALTYIEKSLISHPDNDIRNVVTDLVVEKHHLSKIYYKNTKVETETDRLDELVPRALIALKYDMARCYSEDLRTQISELQNNPDGYDINEILSLMATQKQWQEFCASLATRIGERVYEPLR